MELRLLGPLEAYDDDGVELVIGGAKPRALLARLAIDVGRVVPAERLIEDLWGELPPRSAANSLQGLVVKVRRSLGADAVLTTPVGYRLALAADAVDASTFGALAASAHDQLAVGRPAESLDAAERALAMWRGAPLADFAYEDWARAEIARLEELHVGALETRFEALLALGRHRDAAAELEVATSRYPLRERLRAHLMLALYRSGRQADALRVYQDVRTVLGDELGLEPNAELRRLESAILAHDPSLDLVAGAPASPSPSPPTAGSAPPAVRAHTNLRPSLTALVGRAAELEALDALVAVHRLVTITGPGGAGKTRLALETARTQIERFPDGAWLVELAALTDPGEVPAAVATALQMSDPTVDTEARLADLLGERDILLVLDNCEHVVGAVAALVEELLAVSSGLRLLCTSRESLAVPGEVVWSAPPLDDADALLLFAERARAVQPGFELADVARDVVISICRRLDGMPLAIELAAARTRAFSVEQLSSRLDDRFRLLTSGSRTAMPRQQTLRAVVEWSHHLLFEDERTLFSRLSVFAGRCTLPAIEAVCGDDALPADTIAETLARLVDKSVVQVHRGPDGAHYLVLQTLAQYGREQLDVEALAALRERHARHFAAFAGHGRRAYRGDHQEEWLDALRLQMDDVRAALSWAVENESHAAMEMIAGLGWYWWVAAGVDEGWRWSQAAFAFAPPAELTSHQREDRAAAAVWASFLGLCRGQHEVIDPYLDEADRLTRISEDPDAAAYRLLIMSRIAAGRAQYDRAARWLDDSFAQSERLGAGSLARAFQHYIDGQRALLQGRPRDALEELGLASMLFLSVGDRFASVVCLTEIAFAAESAGEYATMARGLREARRLVAPLGFTSFELVVRARLGTAFTAMGEDDEAEVILLDAVQVARDVSYRPALSFALNGLARLRHRQGRIDEAEAAARESVALQLPDQPTVRASSLAILADAASKRGDRSSAKALFAESLEQAHRANNVGAIAAAEAGLAALAVAAGVSPTV